MRSSIITAVARDGVVHATDNPLVPWWSFTKSVLAAAALRLVSEGRLRLDEPLRDKPFTLRQVLQHRAGLPDYGPMPAYHEAIAAGQPPWPRAELLRRTDADNLLFVSGRDWRYSNVGYLFVRELVEEGADASLGPALTELVFKPLGITGVGIASLPDDLDATAWGNATHYHPGWVYHGLLIGPAGGAALFLHRLLAGALLPSPLLATMCEAYPIGGAIPGRPWQSTGYGLGLMVGVGQPSGRYIGHTGAGPGSTAAVYQRLTESGNGQAQSAVAAFAPLDAPGAVERRAMALAFQG